MQTYRLIAAALLASAAIISTPDKGFAQSQDFFIPGQQQGGRPSGPPAAPRPAAPRPQSRPQQPPVQIAPPQQQQQQQAATQEPQVQLQLPPPPDLPPLAKGTPPPAAVIGVMGVPEVMHAATAALQMEKTIGERREKLNEDAQKEQNAWREMQQSLANDRGKLSPEQIRGREKELQERITNSQKTFRERNAIIQQAAQFGLGQIERTLIGVIRQVAESRGMNLVLHRQQVALNTNEFDITDAVTEQLNKVLPTVQVPPDGVAPPIATQVSAPAPVPAPPPAPAPAPAKK